jgi:hypothetical protein
MSYQTLVIHDHIDDEVPPTPLMDSIVNPKDENNRRIRS